MTTQHTMKPFTTHRLPIRGHTAEVLTWGDPSAEPVLMLHGWMDVAASFQFLVDAMKRDWYVIAPDQRGYGGTDATREARGGYWFADYVADLEAVIMHAQMVGVVDRPRTQPAQPLVEALDQRDGIGIGKCGCGHRRNLASRTPRVTVR